MANSRRVVEDITPHSPNESVVYDLTTTNWDTAPSAATINLYELKPIGTLVLASATVHLNGSVSITGDVVTYPVIRALVSRTKYRVLSLLTFASGNELEAFWDIECE